MNDEEQRDIFSQAIFDYLKLHSKFEDNNNNDNGGFFKTGINTMKIIHSAKKTEIDIKKENNNKKSIGIYRRRTTKRRKYNSSRTR